MGGCGGTGIVADPAPEGLKDVIGRRRRVSEEHQSSACLRHRRTSRVEVLQRVGGITEDV